MDCWGVGPNNCGIGDLEVHPRVEVWREEELWKLQFIPLFFYFNH